MTSLSLRAGRLAVELAPQAGGSIARFRHDDADLLRPMTEEAMASGRGNEGACYPLVPFSNRIANGRLAFDGQEFKLEQNWPGVRHPMHGEGWARAWDVARHDGRSAELVHEHDARKGWPFRYRAQLSFRLDDGGLNVRMAIENLENRAVPAGLGLHPFFTRDADTELAFRAAAVWLGDEDVLPVKRVAVPAEWDHARSRRVEPGLDNCFEDWDGRAVITWPGRALRLELQAAPPFHHTVVYTPANRPYFCVEPVSHVNGKVAEARLAPGATLAGEVAFRVSTL
jgi:aldose 1-epimerase